MLDHSRDKWKSDIMLFLVHTFIKGHATLKEEKNDWHQNIEEQKQIWFADA